MAELEVPVVLLTSACAPVAVLALPALLFRSACEPTRRVKAAGFVGRKRCKADGGVVDPGGQACKRAIPFSSVGVGIASVLGLSAVGVSANQESASAMRTTGKPRRKSERLIEFLVISRVIIFCFHVFVQVGFLSGVELQSSSARKLEPS